jgi:uncharacterized membrane protein
MRDTQISTKEEIPSSAAIMGHPIHPMLIVFPIASFVGALATDVIYLISEDDFWADASYWLLVAGVVTGLLAAVFGAVDFLTSTRIRNLRAAWIHAAFNMGVMVLAIINILLRVDDTAEGIQPWGILISAVIGVMLLISGWYGGEMVYRHKVGVDSRHRT